MAYQNQESDLSAPISPHIMKTMSGTVRDCQGLSGTVRDRQGLSGTVGPLDWLKLRNALRESRWTIRPHRWARWSESPELTTAIAETLLLIPLSNSELSHVLTIVLSLL